MQEQLHESNRLTEAYKGHCGRGQMREKASKLEIEKLMELKTKFKEHMALMKSRMQSLQAQLDFHKERADELGKQLAGFQLQDGDEGYTVKQENIELQRMVVRYHSENIQLAAEVQQLRRQEAQYQTGMQILKDQRRQMPEPARQIPNGSRRTEARTNSLPRQVDVDSFFGSSRDSIKKTRSWAAEDILFRAAASEDEAGVDDGAK